MSLKKKIALSFILSAAIIAVLATFEYVNVVRIKAEIRFLELTDTVRTKSLQLRRHEKNFFLYSPSQSREESASIHRYLDELDVNLAGMVPSERRGSQRSLQALVSRYRTRFDSIEARLEELTRALRIFQRGHRQYAQFFPLIESAFYERPRQASEFLSKVFRLPAQHDLITGLRELDSDINDLRKTGEDIINLSRDLDDRARQKVESAIKLSQVAIVVVFPLFLITGISLLFFITRNIVGRLGLLIDVVDRTGKGAFPHVAAPEQKWGNDEVGVLIRKFDHMEDELAAREAEIERKNRELLQSKKLAAIGTLAAGVAHELNNPLNNIYLSTQVLAREAGESCPPAMKDVMGDILGQTVRVKKIVGDLLEFARGREPQLRDVDMNDLVRRVHARMRSSMDHIAFSLDPAPNSALLLADADQLEQVFINLYQNAVDAMDGRGELRVMVRVVDGTVRTTVSDSGKGLPKETLDKVFEPFYTTKDKGTGLGLAIVFNIISKHRGDIKVESEEGRGTIFTITLPGKGQDHGL
jgi:two-component system, NtrC family, sensor kinase